MTERIERKDDADLAQLVEAWPGLSPEIRQAILRIAQGKQVNIKLIWGKQGYVKIITDAQQEGEIGTDKIRPGQP